MRHQLGAVGGARQRHARGAGEPVHRFRQLLWAAGSDPLLPDNPYADRRISILLMREAPVVPSVNPR
jgi:hypothetical protein